MNKTHKIQRFEKVGLPAHPWKPFWAWVDVKDEAGSEDFCKGILHTRKKWKVKYRIVPFSALRVVKDQNKV